MRRHSRSQSWQISAQTAQVRTWNGEPRSMNPALFDRSLRSRRVRAFGPHRRASRGARTRLHRANAHLAAVQALVDDTAASRSRGMSAVCIRSSAARCDAVAYRWASELNIGTGRWTQSSGPHVARVRKRHDHMSSATTGEGDTVISTGPATVRRPFLSGPAMSSESSRLQSSQLASLSESGRLPAAALHLSGYPGRSSLWSSTESH